MKLRFNGFCLLAIVAAWHFACASSGQSDGEPVLTLKMGNDARVFTRSQLLVHKHVTTLVFNDDTAYKGSITFVTKAVPLTSLLDGMRIPADSLLEFTALDGFTSQVPVDLALNKEKSKSVAYIAIEPPDKPWPVALGKNITPAPYYLVWTNRKASEVRNGFWPYKLAKVTSVDPPHRRWPALSVDSALPLKHPARWGQALVVKYCMACHTINYAGSASAGPDLNVPMNPTEYLTTVGLKAMIRDPLKVRNWPGRHMVGFSVDQISDRELDQIVIYLKHMSDRKILAEKVLPAVAVGVDPGTQAK